MHQPLAALDLTPSSLKSKPSPSSPLHLFLETKKKKKNEQNQNSIKKIMLHHATDVAFFRPNLF
jgi:hypothetical protein